MPIKDPKLEKYLEWARKKWPKTLEDLIKNLRPGQVLISETFTAKSVAPTPTKKEK